MKKLLALVVIAGSITLFSCGNGEKKQDEAAVAKMKADSARTADSMSKAKVADSMAKAKADTTKKASADTTTTTTKKTETKMEKK